jgi:hypothetical protein
MILKFALPHLFAPGVPPRENAEGLRVALDSLIAWNCHYLRHHAARPLYGAGVVYARTDDWETIPALYASGSHGTDAPDSNHPARFGVFGDCKSLTAALVAERRMQGRFAEPQFRFAPMGDGHHMFHILVWNGGPREQGSSYEDPSFKLGMGRDELAHFGLGRQGGGGPYG